MSNQDLGMHQQTLEGPQMSGLPVSQYSAQNPQWPLSHETDPEIHVPPRNPARVPQRPIRAVPNELAPPEQEQRSSYHSDDFLSPSTSSRPLTTSSGISEVSSLGDIPDFPVPVPPPMPAPQQTSRRQPSLGPPPSARRGPASYYPQSSYVSPIAEESESRADTIRSRGSFASSNVFPSKDDGYYDDSRSDDDDVTVVSDNGRRSTASDHDDKSGLVQSTLVRQASLGRRTKPSLTTIKSSDNLDNRTPSLKRKAIPEGEETSARAAVGDAVLAARDGLAGRPTLSSQTSVLLDPSSSSEESLTTKRDARTRLADLDPDDIADRDFEKDFEKQIMVTPPHPLQQGIKQSTLADRVGNRRPPRLDVDAVRDAEARGSLSSLPELIRRATRLAANLDRGKTASRLGLELWESGGSNKEMRQSGTLSDMLAAFPPPGEATPTGNVTPSRMNGTKWSSGAGGLDGEHGTTSDRSRRRRCCGMPMWTFVTLLIVLLFLIAAAVIIPVVLIVIPKMQDDQTAASRNTKLPELPAPTGARTNQCEGIVTCQNGGVPILTGENSCNCVCINGFTGKTCATKADRGCSTINVPGTADNATVGSSILRVFERADDLGIALDTQRLIAFFSSDGLTCSTENALVTFNGLSSRSLQGLETHVAPSRSLPVVAPILQIKQRQAIGEFSQPEPTPSSTLNIDPSPSPPTQPFRKNKTALDFARVGILLLLQETAELDDAAKAQTEIQNYIGDEDSASPSSEAVVFEFEPFDLDVTNYRVEFRNGTVLQANPLSGPD